METIIIAGFLCLIALCVILIVYYIAEYLYEWYIEHFTTNIDPENHDKEQKPKVDITDLSVKMIKQAFSGSKQTIKDSKLNIPDFWTTRQVDMFLEPCRARDCKGTYILLSRVNKTVICNKCGIAIHRYMNAIDVHNNM